MKSAIELYVSEKVRENRLSRGWSYRYLGDCLNVDQSFIYHREAPKGEYAFNLDHINALAKVFECKIYDLLPPYPLD